MGLIGASIILIITSRHGAGLTPDSVAYISAARNLAEGHGLLTFNGLYLVVQPPLYPIILAIIKKIILIDPQISAGYLNAVLFGFIIYLSGLLLLRYLNSFVLVFLGTVSVLISYTLVQASLMALSELLFIFLVLLFFYNFGTYQSKRNFVSLFLFSVSTALACITRYTGVVIILTGIAGILLWGRNNIKEKLWHSFIFILISVLPITVWIIRNYSISGTLVGERAASSYTLFENFRFLINTILPWYFPLNYTGLYFVFIILIVAMWLLFGLDSDKSLNREAIKLISPSLFFVISYTLVIVISSTTTAYDQISDRLLSPIYVPIIFILFFISDKILSWLTKSFHLKSLTVFLILILVLLMGNPVSSSVHIIKEYIEQSGLGYSGALWRASETIEYLNRHKILEKHYTLFSNEPDAVYILTNLNTKRSPAKTFYNSPQLFFNYPDQKDIWQNAKNICLIWLNETNRSFLFTIDELQENIKMTEIARLKDGEIYTFSIN
ncbi:MAG: glycosyltransferase family 39 protein [Ignavibacteriales bacterium]|nr:glycosyltransferase family 39 protein [Ignavibacteriales bacterium]